MFLILNNNISLLRVKYTKYFITFVNNKIYLLKRPAKFKKLTGFNSKSIYTEFLVDLDF